MPNNIIEKLTRKLLFTVGAKLSRSTNEEELLSLIQKLHPLETSRPLIRVGGLGDGGYLLPDDLDGIERCFSPGVAYTSKFEHALASKGIPSSLADYSVNAPIITSNLLKFDKKFIGVANSKKFMTLESWVSRDAPGSNCNLLLQMDIEKYEYPVILATPPETLRRFRIMVIEFHALDVMLKKKTYAYVKSVFEKILKDFFVVHIHPNNCRPPVRLGETLIPPVMEFTFYRKDIASVAGKAYNFPHALDKKNIETLPEVPLPVNWYAFEK
jgi:hypothetical protein